jgi:hypothetical protein
MFHVRREMRLNPVGRLQGAVLAREGPERLKRRTKRLRLGRGGGFLCGGGTGSGAVEERIKPNCAAERDPRGISGPRITPQPFAMPLAEARGSRLAARPLGERIAPPRPRPLWRRRGNTARIWLRPCVHRSGRSRPRGGRRGKPVQILTDPTRLTEKKPRRAFDWWGGTGCPVSFDPTGPPCRSGLLLHGRLRLKIMKGAGIVLPPCGRRWPR